MRKKLPHLPHSEAYSQSYYFKGTNGYLVPLLDNIRSAWNVGSIFRTAGGLGIPKLYLCGITPTPENISVQKTAMGAENYVEWEYSRNALETVKKLQGEGFRLIALEQDLQAIPLHQFQILDSQPIIIVLGNEVSGVDSDLLSLCDYLINIPMFGKNQSFNVEVSFAIAAYALINTINS